MRLPYCLLVGVPATIRAPTAGLVEVGQDLCELPVPDEVRALAAGRAVTLIAWHVLTHRRSDPRYRGMATQIPEHAAVGHFERSRWTDEAWERTDALARATGAQAVVLQTPVSFRSSAEHATRLENFVAQATRPDLALAWEWQPVSWPDRRALELCDRIGLMPVVDPTEGGVPESEFVYLRFRGGPSGRRALRDDDLKKVALAARDRIGWVVFSNATAEQDAERFAAML